MLCYNEIKGEFMKVISIKEPYATLIMNNIKKIETRSWKTSYRGEIFIHASLKSDYKNSSNNLLEKFTRNLELHNGKIICKCQLIDCVYMDRKLTKNIKRNKVEYSCGKYQIGRYAWILDNVEPIIPISAKGRLNIWNFDGNYELVNSKK